MCEQAVRDEPNSDIVVSSGKAPILRLEGIVKEFPGVTALNDVNLSFEKGQIHGIVGENGAGKSTLMNIIDGSYLPTRGEIYVNGCRTVMKDPLFAQRQGIAMMHQEGSLLAHLSIMENIFLSSAETYPGGILKAKKMRRRAEELLEILHLEDIHPNTYVRELSIGQRRLVEVAKVLASSPQILIMDEPTASLTEAETDLLLRVLKELREKGLSIIYISHRLEEIFELADVVSVLRDGNWVGTFPIDEINTQQLIAHMVGRELGSEMDEIRKMETGEKIDRTGKPRLSVRNLSIAGVLQNIEFDLYKGEILGFAGLVGAGRSEIAEAIMGYRRADSISMTMDGKAITNRDPAEAIANGIAMVPEDRREKGILAELSLRENLNLANLPHLKKGLLLSEKLQREVAQEYKETLNIKAPDLEKRIGELSGGNQQKVILARYLSMKELPKVLILDEPTYGIDVGAKAEIYKIIRELESQGMSILLISSDMPELLLLSNRIIALHEGVMKGVIEREDFDQKKILNYASGIA